MCRNYLIAIILLLTILGPYVTDIYSSTYFGKPATYRELLTKLVAGDTLLLESGTYRDGLQIYNLNGNQDKTIVISGLREQEQRPIFLARSGHNTVSIVNSSYIEIRNLILNGCGLEADGVKAEGHADYAHHITVENLLIDGHDAYQDIVGLSTKCPAWNWIIRKNVIKNAGTGMYLGDSDGSAPFVNGLIEFNLILNTMGYNLQIKHQNGRPVQLGIPINGTTIIRHNVFCKEKNGSKGELARPNLLVGHWPLSGPGSKDIYQIYGNFFYENPNESLFQGEGNLALYNNLFVNNHGRAINIQPHNDVPKVIRIFNNTIVATEMGISVTGGSDQYHQKVFGNASFASIPIRASDQQDNIKDKYEAALNCLVNPMGSPGELDLYPKLGKLKGRSIDKNLINFFIDCDRDFNGNKHDGTYRGAYCGEGHNPGWLPKIEVKILTMVDSIPPGAIIDLGFKNQAETSITLCWTASGDDGTSGGPVLAYDLRYSQQVPDNDIDEWFEKAKKVDMLSLPQEPGAQEVINVNNLTPNADYAFVLRSIDDVGNYSEFSNVAIQTKISDNKRKSIIDREFTLQQNFPNPFNAETTINYSVPEGIGDQKNSNLRHVCVKFYNISGSLIKTLVDEKKTPGNYTLKWNGKNFKGENVASGLYVYKLISNNFILSRKLILIR